MRELEKMLKEIQKQGYENISITQMLNWIAQIRRDNRLKKTQK